MAENTGPSQEVRTEAERPEEAREVQSVVDELKASPRIASLGLVNDPEEIIRSVLCSLWRNTPMQQFDTVQGLLPAGLDLLVSTCAQLHGHHEPPDRFSQDMFLRDVSEHLGISRERAFTTATTVLRMLRERIPEDDLEDAVLFLPQGLKELLLQPV